ncbi:MAG: isochorismate synthase [bacterium]
MQTPSSSLPVAQADGPGIFRIAEQALNDARASGRPHLLGFSLPLGGADPLAVLPAMEAIGEPRFFWTHPAAGFSLAAGGAARRLRARGKDRFEEIAAQVTQAFSGWGGTAPSGGPDSGPDREQGAGPGIGPYAIGGFSFFDRMEGEEWTGFQPAELIVPEWTAVKQNGQCRGWISLLVTPEADREAIRKRAAAIAKRLESAASTGKAPPAPVPNGIQAGILAGNHTAGDDPGATPHAGQAESDRAHWIDSVRSASGRIREGQLDKVVLARVMDLQCPSRPSPYPILAGLRTNYPDCYTFLFDPGGGKVFLGASPERMARFGGGKIELTALAGTVPRGADPSSDAAHGRYLLANPKEREEHRIVVEDIVEAVRGLGRVEFPEIPRVVKLNNLQHLSTPITLVPNTPQHPIALLGKLHPTAAVGGRPRETAFRLIGEFERFERGWYGSPIGWMNAGGEGEFAVSLRSGLLDGSRLRLFAGGGIMADSEPEREYEETRIKFQPLLSALNGTC